MTNCRHARPSVAHRFLRLVAFVGCLVPVSGAAARGDDFAEAIDRTVDQWQPTRDERRFDQIGWAKDILRARELAREHSRPVFLFTYDGRSIALKRC